MKYFSKRQNKYDFHLLEQQYDHHDFHRPIHYQSFKEGHIYNTMSSSGTLWRAESEDSTSNSETDSETSES